MNKLTHKAILASAGSGKTFQLAHRYIRILAEKDADGGVVAPDRICAMTFTRKAAGEIFDNIALYLREAATDENGGLARANDNLGGLVLTQEEYLILLRRFIDDLHRAKIGTFDSFIVGIAKAFPVELGLPMSFQVTDNNGATAKENRRRILDHILGSGDSSKEGKTFLESFKLATIGQEEKTVDRLLEQFLANMHSSFRLCPDGSKWGNPDLVWPNGNPYPLNPNYDPRAVNDTLEKWHDSISAEGREKKLYDSIYSIGKDMVFYDHSSSSAELPGATGKAFQQMLEGIGSMRSGDFTISYYNKDYAIPLDISQCLAEIFENVLSIEYDRMLRRTVGLFSLLSTYDNIYQELSATYGCFSFTDVHYLLSDGGEDKRLISRKKGVDRLYIDYRMDCRLDHWLLDEFQDTSDLQWNVFANLILEIIQAEDNRSFFYVGDVKQAIYGWRGGNHKLFQRILAEYNMPGQPPVIEDENLPFTRRCSQPVINTVNKVFSKLPTEIPAAASDEWSNIWRDHDTASPTKDDGYVALLDIPYEKDAEAQWERRSWLVADMLNEMQPVERGLKVGILVRDNKFGKKLVNLLSEECEGMNFVHEGESGVADNELAKLLLSLIKAAAHPADEFAWQYIQMTPLAAVLAKKKITQGTLPEVVLSDLQDNGYQSFIGKWGRELSGVLSLGRYGAECLQRLESAAAEYDAAGLYDCNGFLLYIENYRVREQPASGSVRVMTIHQSKGLEFDVVILPQLQEGNDGDMIKAGNLDLLCAGDRNDPAWVQKMMRSDFINVDPELRAAMESENEAHCFDALCVMYVAMTRARHAMYMVTSSSKTTPDTMHPSVFLKTQLTGEANPEAEPNISINDNDYVKLYDDGVGWDWYQKSWPVIKQEVQESIVETVSDDYSSRSERNVVLQYIEPSKETSILKNAGSLFEARSSDIMDFGSAIHEMFEQVEWAEDADPEKIITEWEASSKYDEAVTIDVIEQFRNCMQSDSVRNLLSKPKGNIDLPWREKRFEVVLDGGFVSGAFDRVIIQRDDSGKPNSANIIDYKSSLASSEAEINAKVESYTSQMHVYRDALSRILGLDSKDIKLNLLFTKQQTVITVK